MNYVSMFTASARNVRAKFTVQLYPIEIGVWYMVFLVLIVFKVWLSSFMAAVIS